MRSMVAVGLAALGVLWSSPVHSGVQEDAVSAAESAAETAAGTPEGKRFKEALQQAFGREHGTTIQRCASKTRRPDLSDFHLFLRVDGAGSVDQVLVEPSTTLAACVQKKLVSWKTSVPPHASFWVDIGVRMKRK